jgi:hypothetical protein
MAPNTMQEQRSTPRTPTAFAVASSSSLILGFLTRLWKSCRPSGHSNSAARRLVWLVTLFCCNVATTDSRKQHYGSPNARSLKVINRSGVTIDVFWIHSVTGNLSASQTKGEGIVFGSETGISSYVGHAFEVQEMPKIANSTTCRKGGLPCRKAHFVCNAHHDQWITIDRNFTLQLQDSQSRARAKAQAVLSNCTDSTAWNTTTTTTTSLNETISPEAWQQKVKDFTDCLLHQAEQEINRTSSEIAFQGAIRSELGAKLARYSCSPNVVASQVRVTTSPSLHNSSYQDQMVQTLFASDTNRIRLYTDFVSPTECRAILSNNISTQIIPSTLQTKIAALLASEVPSITTSSSSYTNMTTTVRILESNKNKNSAVCEVDATDGSCTTATATTTTLEPKDDSNDMPTLDQDSIVVTTNTTTDSIVARLLLTCLDSSDDATNSTSSNNKDDTSTTTTATTTSRRGLIIFPHTGVRIVPTQGAAALIEYDDMDNVHGKNQTVSEAFVHEHVICTGSTSSSTDTAGTPDAPRVGLVEQVLRWSNDSTKSS